MKNMNLKFLGMLILVVLLLAACGPASIPVTGEKVAPSKAEPIEGSEFSRLTLTEKAAQRLNIQTTPVQIKEMSSEHLAVPYSAILYGLEERLSLSTISTGIGWLLWKDRKSTHRL